MRKRILYIFSSLLFSLRFYIWSLRKVGACPGKLRKANQEKMETIDLGFSILVLYLFFFTILVALPILGDSVYSQRNRFSIRKSVSTFACYPVVTKESLLLAFSTMRRRDFYFRKNRGGELRFVYFICLCILN